MLEGVIKPAQHKAISVVVIFKFYVVVQVVSLSILHALLLLGRKYESS